MKSLRSSRLINLSPTAREQVVRILGTASDAGSLERAMAAASVRPDTEFREEDRSTAPWHCPDATAHKLEQLYASQKDADSWKPGGTDDIAWESNQLARAQIYQALRIPVEPCEPGLNSCMHAPAGPVELDNA